jgi:dTDP-4-dehydrorhamnose 3,5-epimerase
VRVFETAIPDVKFVESDYHTDARGFFAETWSERQFGSMGLSTSFVQDNLALSITAGTIRGLHFQIGESAQGKLVRIVRGAIFDVALDLRVASATFGQHVAVTLTHDSRRQLWIPPGFAHGYCTLMPNTEIFYKATRAYDPIAERGVRWDDPDLQIAWPVAPATAVISSRDQALPSFAEIRSMLNDVSQQ